jgi:hypothetical protein
MIGQLQLGRVRFSGAAGKKMISSLLLIIALGAIAGARGAGT